jgi:ribonuclease T1
LWPAPGRPAPYNGHMPSRPQPEKPGIPNWMRILGIVILLLFALVSNWETLSGGSPTSASTRTPATRPTAAETPEVAATPDTAPASDDLIVHDVSIYDLDGNLAYQGDVDLGPTLDRIARGESDSHPNDGAVFQNREGLLPDQDGGYYHEYVVRTPGLDSVGPQRLILGASGEVYYTPDHYQTFTQIR